MPPKRKIKDKLAARLTPYSGERRREGLLTVGELTHRVDSLARTMGELQRYGGLGDVPSDKPAVRDTDEIKFSQRFLSRSEAVKADITLPIDNGMSEARIVYDSDTADGPPLGLVIQTKPEDGVEERGYEHYALGWYSNRRHALSAEVDRVPYIAMIKPSGAESLMTSEEFMERVGQRLEKGIELKRKQLIATGVGKTATSDMLVLVGADDIPRR